MEGNLEGNVNEKDLTSSYDLIERVCILTPEYKIPGNLSSLPTIPCDDTVLRY